MSRSVSIGLLVAGVVLLVVAAVEHFALRVEVIPHLAIFLGVIAVILLAVGGLGLLRPDNAG
jgi:hypothetical protein